MSIILNTDSYKVSMFKQYPPGTTAVHSYIEGRVSAIDDSFDRPPHLRGVGYEPMLFFGLQAFIQEHLTKPITQEDIDEAAALLQVHGEPFNREGWEYILNTHKGFLPLEIKAVPEGTVLLSGNVLVTVENTDPACFWLTTYVETALLRAVWYPTTVATKSWRIKNLISRALSGTGDRSGLEFKLHDFGARGVSSLESAGIGGAAHLINFRGTDTLSGVLWANKYYDAGVAGFSIPAAEHSTITSWGREGEVDAYRNMLRQFGGSGKIVAVVSDSYDIFHAAEKLWGEALREEVIASGATVVIRPDSGDPVEVNLKLLDILGERFGYTTNSKGYKVLNHVRIIQGDGVNYGVIHRILHEMSNRRWSADNIAFGMGSALLQNVNRDNLRFAMKCSAVQTNGEWRPVNKAPSTDKNKASKAGLWMLYRDQQGTYYSAPKGTPRAPTDEEALQLVYRNGLTHNRISFDRVRANAEDCPTLYKQIFN